MGAEKGEGNLINEMLPTTPPPRKPLPTTETFLELLEGGREKLLQPFSKDEALRIASLKQHLDNNECNPEWLKSRRAYLDVPRATGSTVAEIFRDPLRQVKDKTTNLYVQSPGYHTPYGNQRQFLKEKLWGAPFDGTIPACVYGNENEDNAQECLEVYVKRMIALKEPLLFNGDKVPYIIIKYKLDNPGLLVHCTIPILAMSPDGVLTLWLKPAQASSSCCSDADAAPVLVKKTILLEYKCPYSRRFLCYLKPSENIYPLKPSPSDMVQRPWPSYYVTQVQHGMGIINENLSVYPWDFVEEAWCVVWVPPTCHDDGPMARTRPVTNFAYKQRGRAPGDTSDVLFTNLGTIQLCRIPFACDFFDRMRNEVIRYILEDALPMFLLKKLGCLLPNECQACQLPLDVSVDDEKEKD